MYVCVRLVFRLSPQRNVERKKEKKSKRKGGKKVSILDGGDEGAEETTLLEDGENSVDEWGEGFSDEEEGMMDEFGATSSVMHSPQGVSCFSWICMVSFVGWIPFLCVFSVVFFFLSHAFPVCAAGPWQRASDPLWNRTRRGRSW